MDYRACVVDSVVECQRFRVKRKMPLKNTVGSRLSLGDVLRFREAFITRRLHREREEGIREELILLDASLFHLK